MRSNSLSHPVPTLNTGHRPPGRTLILHYIVDSKTVCEAEHRLTADTRFIELPIPVLHRLMMGR